MSPPNDPSDMAVASSFENTSDDSDMSSLHALYDSDQGTITDPLKSEWKERMHRFENGRRYPATANQNHALVPNDEVSQDQLDLNHQICCDVMTINERPDWNPDTEAPMLYRSPLQEYPQKVLDIGTGTGIWAIQLGDAYPNTKVIGSDITPIQPEWVPLNVQFEVEDATADWARDSNSFDLLYCRSMHAVFSEATWPKVCHNAFRVLKPGGYFEVFGEVPRVCSDDNSIPNNWMFKTWLENIDEGLKAWGIKMCIDESIKQNMEDAGFTDVKQVFYKVPIGPWPKNPIMKNIGAMFLVSLLQGMEGWSLVLFTQQLGWSPDQVQEHLTQVKKALRSKKAHAYLNFCCTYGRKPTEGQEIQSLADSIMVTDLGQT